MDVIDVTCPQGHKLKARSKHIGKELPCPACGAKVFVSAPAAKESLDSPSSPSSDFSDLANLDLSTFDSSAAPTWETPLPTRSGFPGGGATYPAAPMPAVPYATNGVPGSSSANTGRTAAGANSSKTWLIVGACVAGGTLLLILAVIAVGAMFRGEGTQDKSTLDPFLAALANVGRDDAKEMDKKLKSIGDAFNEYSHSIRSFSPPVLEATGSAGERVFRPSPLSWRVHLLPFLGHQELHEKFHLDEPWDSAHNQSLLEKMPDIYRLRESDKDTTRLQIFTGPDGFFKPDKRIGPENIVDGINYTILVVAVGPDRAIPWTKPDDLAVDKADPWRPLGTLPDNLLHCVLVDTAVLRLRRDTPNEKLLALISPNDGIDVKPEDYVYRNKNR